jgi:hypothetical protein
VQPGTSEDLLSRLEDHIAGILVGFDASQFAADLAHRIQQDAFGESQRGEVETLTHVKMAPNGLPSVTYYKPRVAAEIVLTVLAGVLAKCDPAVLGCIALAGICAAERAKVAFTPSEGTLFWIVWTGMEHRVKRDAAHERFTELAVRTGRFSAQDFDVALGRLSGLDCVSVDDTWLEVTDRVVLTGIYGMANLL